MSESLLTILKFCLLALVYLFLARVVFTVARELRGTPVPAVAVEPPAGAPSPARRGKRGWQLTILEPATLSGSTYTVDGEATIGRGGGCVVPLPADTFVSHVHARVFDRDGKLWVEDLKSTNGTFVNGKQVTEPIQLHRGDRLQIGETVLEPTR